MESRPWMETNTVAAAAQTYRFSSSISEIEEEGNNSSELFEINHGVALESVREEGDESSSLFSVDVNEAAEESVYVAVGKSESSMQALSWTLTHFVNTSTILYLIHVFPVIRHIPSPLGMLPKSQVSPAQVEKYMAQEREKRGQLLQKFLDICSASKVKVKVVDTMLIESDMVAKAILDLITILNIRKLVVGTTNSNPTPRKLLNSRKGVMGIADQIFQSAPNTCEVKVVCQGKEVSSQMVRSPSPSPHGNQDNFKLQEADHRHEHGDNNSFSCICFKPKF
ncbi:hypothetical protein DITRI_Ditri02bG0000400 [Diplodiscus trichospermus]